MFKVLSVTEVSDEYRGVVKTLDNGVHIARVAQVLQTREAATLSCTQ